MEKAPVMILFFNRPDNLKEVFDAVRKYQPSELFLVQDGAREGRLDDYENVQKCRDIVANIDWKCKVRRNYSEHNLSCDYREYTGIDWCFSFVDRLIILEDDCVPSQSFLHYVKNAWKSTKMIAVFILFPVLIALGNMIVLMITCFL